MSVEFGQLKNRMLKTKDLRTERMPEQFLKPMEVARRLKVKRTTFYRLRPKLVALGLKTARIDGYVRYLESSLDKAMLRLAEMEI